MGLCVPGLMNDEKTTVRQSVNVPGLNGVRLDELVAAALAGTPATVAVATDAYATAYDLYETLRLPGRILSLAIGTGVGACVLDEGRPLHVDGESPGHFGQMDVSIAGHPVVGPDGGAGSLEGYISSAALVARYGPGETWLIAVAAGRSAAAGAGAGDPDRARAVPAASCFSSRGHRDSPGPFAG